jgi:pyridoxal phosphate-dependent aminotransferase EpsN
MGPLEQQLIAEVFASNWIAPLGPHVDAFQSEFAKIVGSSQAVALSSGTAALHLAIQLTGAGPGDDVLVSTLTFAASANPVRYVGATPVFIDSERESWNMDPQLLCEELARRARVGKLPKAVVLVHLYGQCANIGPIMAACQRFGIPVIEDAAEALGATYQGEHPGTFGRMGIFSFNGNKIITTSGGGMLVTEDALLAARALKLATQARDRAPHYEHSEIGYNYRMSNVLAAIGRGQLRVLEDRVQARRRNFEYYVEALADIPGLEFQPEAPWGRHTRWLTTLTLDQREYGASTTTLRQALEASNIEARPVWKPMHLQPVFREFPVVGGSVAADLFARGICLPSGSSLTEAELERVCDIVRSVHRMASPRRYPTPSSGSMRQLA